MLFRSGDLSEADQAIIDHESTTDDGKRWRLEYYHTKVNRRKAEVAVVDRISRPAISAEVAT